jgi:hypothetical protein
MLTDYHTEEVRKRFSRMEATFNPEEETHRELLLKQEIDLVNKSNLAYVGPVYFGTPLQTDETSEFVYDTGSGYLTTTSTGCSTCITSQYYSPSTSTTAGVKSSNSMTLSYGSATLTGYLGTDQVCLNTDMCVSNFEFLVVTKQSGLNGSSGILGLSPADEA